MGFTPDIAGLNELAVCVLCTSPPIEPPDTKPGSAGLLLAFALELSFIPRFWEIEEAATKLLLNCAIIPVLRELTAADLVGTELDTGILVSGV